MYTFKQYPLNTYVCKILLSKRVQGHGLIFESINERGFGFK